jgi:hypothetical protein
MGWFSGDDDYSDYAADAAAREAEGGPSGRYDLGRFEGTDTDIPQDVQARLVEIDPMNEIEALAGAFNPIPFTVPSMSTYVDPRTLDKYSYTGLDVGAFGLKGGNIYSALTPFGQETNLAGGESQSAPGLMSAVGAEPAQGFGQFASRRQQPTTGKTMKDILSDIKIPKPTVSQKLGLNPFVGMPRVF